MPNEAGRHDRFVDLVGAFYRLTDTDLPYFECQAHEAIAFDVQVDGVDVQVGFDPLGTADMCIFIYSAFGTVPQHQGDQVLLDLLQCNLPMARMRHAVYCFDPNERLIAWYQRLDIETTDAQALHREIRHVAVQALQWRKGGLQREAAPAVWVAPT